MKVNKVEFIKKLREETGLGLFDAKKAMQEADYDYAKALGLLLARGGKRIKESDGFGSNGRIETYNHNGRIGVLIDVACGTDFVANTDEFKNLCRELAMQVAATDPLSIQDMMESAYIRDPSKKVKDVIYGVAVNCGERVAVHRFARFVLNEPGRGLSTLEPPEPAAPTSQKLKTEQNERENVPLVV